MLWMRIRTAESAPASRNGWQSKRFQVVGLAAQAVQKLSILRQPRCDLGTPGLGKYLGGTLTKLSSIDLTASILPIGNEISTVTQHVTVQA